jgi:antitoxin YefM
MKNAVTTTFAKDNFSLLVEQVEKTHKPIYVKGKHKAVILSKEDYESMKETLYLHSVPGLVQSILDASNAPDDEYISAKEFWKK